MHDTLNNYELAGIVKPHAEALKLELAAAWPKPPLFSLVAAAVGVQFAVLFRELEDEDQRQEALIAFNTLIASFDVNLHIAPRDLLQ
jgi:hypothetical protein